MHAVTHPVSSYSIVGIVIAVIFAPVAILGTLFAITRALVGG
jgi:type IV secretory pathway VirB6-like protein